MVKVGDKVKLLSENEQRRLERSGVVGTHTLNATRGDYDAVFTVVRISNDGQNAYLDKKINGKLANPRIERLTVVGSAVAKPRVAPVNDVANFDKAPMPKAADARPTFANAGGATMNKKTNPTLDKVSKATNTIVDAIHSMLVQSGDIGLSPSGLSINNRVFSKKEKALLDVGGTVVSNVPVGFRVAVDAKDIVANDIIFSAQGEPLFVQDIKKEKGNDKRDTYLLTAVSAMDDKKSIMYPTLDLFGGQTYDKLVTPFAWDNGCNPFVNATTMSVLSYLTGGTDAVVEKIVPQALRYVGKINFPKLMQDKRVAFLLPVLAVAYKVAKDNNISLNNFTDIDFKRLSKKVDKKVLAVLLLAILTVVYFNKDAIAKAILASKIATLPVIGVFSTGLANVLVSIPSLNVKEKVLGAVATKVRVD